MPIKLTHTNEESIQNKTYNGSTLFSKTGCPDTFLKNIIAALNDADITIIRELDTTKHSFTAKTPLPYSPSQFPSKQTMDYQGAIRVNIYKTQGTSYPLAVHIQAQVKGNLYRSNEALKAAFKSFDDAGFNLKPHAHVTEKPFPEHNESRQLTSKL